MAVTCNWPLGNGKVLTFDVYDRNKGWNNVPGLYIFAYQTTNGWRALYVGQAESFQSRLPTHERLNEAVMIGATHIHAFIAPLKTDRDTWERMLIRHLQPPLNDQHKNFAPA